MCNHVIDYINLALERSGWTTHAKPNHLISCKKRNMRDSKELALEDDYVIKAIERGIISFSQGRITYHLKQNKSYRWNDPEEWVRARTISFLIIEKGYPTNRINTEVRVPRRTPNDFADIVVYKDDRCQLPYLIVENKASGQSSSNRRQGVEQAFGNTNSLRAPFALYDEFSRTFFYDVGNYPPGCIFR